MKKFTFSVAIFTIAIQLKGQYFEMRQSPTAQGHRLSSGTRLTAPLGDLMTSFEPVTAPANLGGFNFYVTEKALPLPYGSGGTNQRGYRVFINSQDCSGTQTLLSNMSGLTALQVKINGSGLPIADLALAGSCREGCFFATLNRLVLNAPPSKMFYRFPSVSAQQPSKPFMVQSSTAYHYYICGSFQQDIYVIKVNETGGVIWSQFYSAWNHSDSFDHTMRPGTIIEDPYSPGDIVIAGSVEIPGRDREGFLMKLSGNSGNVNLFTTYGQPGLGIEGFSTIVPASSSGNNFAAGYVLGGAAGNPKTGIKPWILKLNANGGVIWSRIITSTFDTSANNILSINERINPSSGKIEYYSLLNSTTGFIVGKLDEIGQPVNVSDPSKNSEFGYNISASEIASPNNLSIENGTVGLPPTGIHVYGTLNSSISNEVFIVSSYFNGVSGCQSITNLGGSEEISTQMNFDPYFVYAGLQACPNITIQNVSNGGGFYGCGGGLSTNGSNQRSPVVSSIGETEGIAPGVKVFPNPVKGVAKITFPASQNSLSTISIYDISGRMVFNTSITEKAGIAELNYELDFKAMQVEPGIYLIRMLSGDRILQKKIIYTG
jgi:hypothetical protein